jgi:DNA modification methylase
VEEEMIEPYYQDEYVTLYCGDCREVMKELQDGSVDLVLSDPPYGVSYVSPWRSRNGPLRVPIAGDSNLDWTEVLLEVDRLLKNNSHAYLFAAAQRTEEIIKNLPVLWTPKNILVWDKGDAGTVGDLECGYGYNYEMIIYAMKGRRKLQGPRPRALMRYDWSGNRDPVHPTVKPVGFLKRFILSSSSPGECVLDMFAGSGTTLRAAKDLNRKAIGIELEEKYCEQAVKRLHQEALNIWESDAA